MRSNEFEVLCSTLDMYGGSEEYRGAVLVAALIRTFQKSLSYGIAVGDKSFDIDIHEVNAGKLPFRLYCTFSKTYLYLFESLI